MGVLDVVLKVLEVLDDSLKEKPRIYEPYFRPKPDTNYVSSESHFEDHTYVPPELHYEDRICVSPKPSFKDHTEEYAAMSDSEKLVEILKKLDQLKHTLSNISEKIDNIYDQVGTDRGELAEKINSLNLEINGY